MRKMKALIVAGTGSGTGKTTVTLGIMEAFRRRGLRVQPFKAGPDYIDPGHHGALLGRPSYNLDTWMMGPGRVRSTFRRCSAGAEVAVIEGVMGLFDGRHGSDEGSTAHLAKLLKAPVLLVVNAEKMARSAGAVVSGFETFDPGVRVKWVVFNRVGSPGHYEVLKNSIKKSSKVRVLGYLPRDEGLAMPERHLGLVTHLDMKNNRWKAFMDRVDDAVERHIDIQGLLSALSLQTRRRRLKTIRIPGADKALRPVKAAGKGTRIAVALDSAFCFYYQENLDILRGLGAELVFFSPMKDRGLPRGTLGLYLGGGYPELYAGALEANAALRQEVKSAARAGLPIYAECGGLMYLGRSIRDISGASFRMAGVFPWTVRMTSKRKALGYREAVATANCPMLGEGLKLRGHEYHYSELTKSPPPAIKRAFKLGPGGGGGSGSTDGDGYLYKNTLAAYTHLHFASNIEFASGFVEMCSGVKSAGIKT